MIKIKKRRGTLKDWINLKGFEPIKTLRTVSKHVDLSMVFYATFPTLARVLKESGMTAEKWDEVVQIMNLEQKVNQAIAIDGGKKPRIEHVLMVVAEALHRAFFDTYPGLKNRCEREHEFLMSKAITRDGVKIARGYTRAWHGPVRHLPEIRYMAIKDGKLVGADKKLHSRMFSGLKNQAGNTAIQTLEVYEAAQMVHCLHTNFKNNEMQSYIFNYVHDSIDLIVYNGEDNGVYGILKETIVQPRWPRYGIPLEMDGEISSLEDRTKEFYKHGHSISIMDKKLPEGIKFENTIRK